MTTLTIELPDELAEEARTKGLLAPRAIEAMIRDALRRTAVGDLFEAADKLAAAEFPPMTLTEIQEEVNAVSFGETATCVWYLTRTSWCRGSSGKARQGDCWTWHAGGRVVLFSSGVEAGFVAGDTDSPAGRSVAPRERKRDRATIVMIATPKCHGRNDGLVDLPGPAIAGEMAAW